MRTEPVLLTESAMALVESTLPALCDRGGWIYVVAAAQSDHVHLLCGAKSAIHGKQIRTLVKRWLTQALNDKLPGPMHSPWWADGGSNKPIKNRGYFQNVYSYIEKQRMNR